MIVIEMSSTKVKVPTGTKKWNNLIGDPFRSETRFVVGHNRSSRFVLLAMSHKARRGQIFRYHFAGTKVSEL